MEKNFYVAHEIPGRIRFKIVRKLNDKDWICLTTFTKNIDGITGVRINTLANSLIVNYDNRLKKEKIIEDLRNYFEQEKENILLSMKLTQERDLFHILRSGLLLITLPILPSFLKSLFTFISISPLLIRGIRTLLFEGMKADTLSALAVFVTYLQNKFFTANLTYMLIEIGEYIESLISKKTDDAIIKLIKPKIDKVLVWRDNELIELDLEEILINDIILVNSGNIIPVDGVVVGGTASVDESSLTGEALPVKKEKGDMVLSGTSVREGSLEIRVEKTGKDTITARISSYILNALASKSNIQGYLEKIGDRSVIATFILGIIVFLITRNIKRAVSVLLVDYVCSIKLATSVAFKSAIHHAATKGAIIKGSNVFEKLASSNIFVFDKTGTLTTDYMDITYVKSFDTNLSEDDIIALAASIEEHYSHPIGEAIVRYAKEKNLNHIKHSNVDYIIAHGLKTKIENKEVLIGSRHFIEEDEKILFSNYESILSKLIEDGDTIIYISIDRKPSGIIALKEKIRLDAKKTISTLKKNGITKIIMLTGDEKSKALSIAKNLDIDEIYYELLPDEKSKIIEILKTDKKNIITYCGDGINDAPALSIADVSIAIYNASDMAKDISDIVLTKNEIYPVALSRELARSVLKKINDNFNLSISINSFILILASIGILNPFTSALLHNILTIGVLFNSLVGEVNITSHDKQ